MVTVYVWRPKGGNVGHASLKLTNGTYISWWPRGAKTTDGMLKGVPAQKNINYADDVDLEGRDADAEIQLPDVLDEGKIRTWYQGFGGNYHIATRNCATVVYRALSIGGSNAYVDSDTSYGVWTPAAIEKYARELSQ